MNVYCDFSSISFCPYSYDPRDEEHNDDFLDWTFQDEIEDIRKHPNFLLEFEHDRLDL